MGSKNIIIKNKNSTDYDILFPQTKGENTLINQDIAANYGFDENTNLNEILLQNTILDTDIGDIKFSLSKVAPNDQWVPMLGQEVTDKDYPELIQRYLHGANWGESDLINLAEYFDDAASSPLFRRPDIYTNDENYVFVVFKDSSGNGVLYYKPKTSLSFKGGWVRYQFTNFYISCIKKLTEQQYILCTFYRSSNSVYQLVNITDTSFDVITSSTMSSRIVETSIGYKNGMYYAYYRDDGASKIYYGTNLKNVLNASTNYLGDLDGYTYNNFTYFFVNPANNKRYIICGKKTSERNTTGTYSGKNLYGNKFLIYECDGSTPVSLSNIFYPNNIEKSSYLFYSIDDIKLYNSQIYLLSGGYRGNDTVQYCSVWSGNDIFSLSLIETIIDNQNGTNCQYGLFNSGNYISCCFKPSSSQHYHYYNINTNETWFSNTNQCYNMFNSYINRPSVSGLYLAKSPFGGTVALPNIRSIQYTDSTSSLRSIGVNAYIKAK